MTAFTPEFRIGASAFVVTVLGYNVAMYGARIGSVTLQAFGGVIIVLAWLAGPDPIRWAGYLTHFAMKSVQTRL